MTTGARAAAVLSLLLAGCASTGGPPDTAADIGAAAGRAATVVLGQLPVVNTALGAVDEARAKLAERRDLRAAAASAARTAGRRWEQCRENPCLYADRCAELFPADFMVPDCPDGGGTDAAVPRSTVVDRLVALEGPPFLAPTRGEICYGVGLTAQANQAALAMFAAPWTVAKCRRLLEELVPVYRAEALRCYGRSDDALVLLMYWRGGGGSGYCGTPLADLPDRLRGDAAALPESRRRLLADDLAVVAGIPP